MINNCGFSHRFKGQRIPRCGHARRGCRECWTKYHGVHGHKGTQQDCGLCGGGLDVFPSASVAALETLATDFDLV